MSQPSSIDSAIQGVFGPVVDVLEKVVFFSIPLGGADVPLVVLWLVAGGLFVTFWLRVRPVRDAMQTIRIVRGHMSRHADPGQVTSFQAMATELAGTIGLGNIAGVAVAITLGGPGATLWIIFAGLLGMALKLAEATLAQMFRRVNADGSITGGPMVYLTDGLASIGKPKLGKIMGLTYALCFMIAAMGAGNIFQSNQITMHLVDITGGTASPLLGRGWLVGIGLAVGAGFVILGGIQKIASWTSRLVPVMAALYFAATIIIVLVNFHEIPHAFQLIIQGGFTGEGIKGGVIGVAIIGIQRALFSNVAGVGSAGLAHSIAKNNRPAEEGFVAAWEPFIDSVVVCTLTAFAIIVTGEYKNQGQDGILLTTRAFETVHSAFPIILSICIVLFGFSTVLSYSFYGRQGVSFVFHGSKTACRAYDIVYLLMIVVGAAVSLDTVVRFSDAVFFVVVVPNLLGIYLLSGKLKAEIQGYRRMVDSGQYNVVPESERSTLLGKPKVDTVTDASDET